MDGDNNDGTTNMDMNTNHETTGIGSDNNEGTMEMENGNGGGNMPGTNMDNGHHEMTMNHDSNHQQNMHPSMNDKPTTTNNDNHNMDATDHGNHNNHNMNLDELESFLDGNNQPFCVSSNSHLLHGGNGGSGGMIMYMDGFRWSLADNSPCLNLFFPGWTLDTSGKFAGAVLGVLALAVVTEGISKFRYVVQRRFRQARRTSSVRSPLKHRCAIASLHTLQALMGYVLMLVTMTFSLELLLTVIVGLGLGYFLFFSEDDHHVTTNPCCSFMQNEADELEKEDGIVVQSTTGACCEPQDKETASPNNSQSSSIADSTLVDVESGDDKNQ